MFTCTKLTLLPLCYLLTVSYAAEYDHTNGKRKKCVLVDGSPLTEHVIKTKEYKGKGLKIATVTPRVQDWCDSKPKCKGYTIAKSVDRNKNIFKALLLNKGAKSNNTTNRFRLLKDEKDGMEKKEKKEKDDNSKKNNSNKSDKNKVVNTAKATYFCGAQITRTASPTTYPTPSPTRDYDIFANKKCKETKGRKAPKKKLGVQTLEICQKKCGFMKSCKMWDYNGKNKVCKLYIYKNDGLRDMPAEKNSTCGRLPQPTQAPVAPTRPPTRRPTRATVSPTTKPPATVCELKVVHAHPFQKVNKSPYYGYQADWLEIGKRSADNDNLCTYYYKNGNSGGQPDWCRYTSSHDSAIINNEEDEYYAEDEILSMETFIVKHAAANQTKINAYHYFADKLYYEENERWNSYMMAPEVKIYNLSHDEQKQVGKTSYSHPTNKNIPDLKRDSSDEVHPNEWYEGNMEIVVNCSEWCWCTVESFTTSTGNVYAYYRENGPSTDAQRKSNARSVEPLARGRDPSALRKGAL